MVQRQVNEIKLLIRVLQRSSSLQQFREEHVETAGRQKRQRRDLRADERNERRSSHEKEEDGDDSVGDCSLLIRAIEENETSASARRFELESSSPANHLFERVGGAVDGSVCFKELDITEVSEVVRRVEPEQKTDTVPRVLQRIPLTSQIPQDARTEILRLQRYSMTLLQSSLPIRQVVRRREQLGALSLRLRDSGRVGAILHLESNVREAGSGEKVVTVCC